ncbi:MAG: DUF262 domain-containing protein [Leucobacter sp.]
MQDILKPERRYIIPTFQRDYEWTKDDQWRLLFEDLAMTADRVLESRGPEKSVSGARTQKVVSPHFLGAIVLAALPFDAGNVALRSVIDGQQRLTTMQLMCRGLLDVLTEFNSDRAPSINRMLFNPADVVQTTDEIYKLWPRRKDRDIWPQAMAATPPARQASEHPYLQARRFFAEQALEYARNELDEIDQDRLTALATGLSAFFKLVVIDLDENDDAQVIFEVLNGRQTPLSAIDLVKNLLFLRAELNNEDVERLYDAYWAPFDDAWWKERIGRGHAARGHRDVVLSVWLTAVSGEEANVSHLYREARDYLEHGPETEVALQELSAFAESYKIIYGQIEAPDPLLRDTYNRIRALDITTAVPLLAWLLTLSGESLSIEDHVRTVQAIESWAMRRSFAGWQTRGYGTHFARILRVAKSAHQAGEGIAEIIEDALLTGNLGWPTDTEVRFAFTTRKFYGGISPARIRLLLGTIDHQLRSEDENEPPAILEYGDLQIEHVMPRSWTAHWPIPDETGSALIPNESDPLWLHKKAERDRALNRIGNLTLVTASFNNDLSNQSWALKKPEFATQKSLVINYELGASEAWNEQEIEDRSQRLADVALRVWKRPSIYE